MNLRRPITAVGAAITAFLVVAVSVIELLDIEFSALVGLPVGLIAGMVVFVLLLLRHDDADEPVRWVLGGFAGFGYGILLALGTAYVNIVDVGFEGTVGVGVAAAVVAFLGAAFLDRRETPKQT
ncbi:MAG: hypothetical protein U5J64_12100 [Halobacteriales archaeon]|nr:hypothetical protein [Halobacteriales archaeon]